MKIALEGMPRRSFLITLGIAFLMLFALRLKAFWRPFIVSPRKGNRPPSRPNAFKTEDRASVGVVHGRDPERMVREAFDLIGGIEKLDLLGKVILLKPNIVSGALSPATTNPRLIRAVAKILFESGARRVLVGDMSAFIKLPTRKNMENSFIKMMVEETGAELVPFDEADWVSVDLPQGQYVKKVFVTEVLYQVDRIINLPVIKTHRSATYSVALKNFVGATHFRQRPFLVDRHHWEEVIADLNLAYTPDLHIVDGTRVMAEGGPWDGKAVDANLIIATGDRIAADVVGLGVLKRYSQLPQIKEVDVWEQRQVKRAVELGLGVRGEEEIELLEKDLAPEIPGFNEVVRTIKREVLREEVE
jgi:uncharacterized protein (DUF362 family)